VTRKVEFAPTRGIERHQLPPRRLQNATKSPIVAIPSPFKREAMRGRNHLPIEWLAAGDAAASAAASVTIRNVTVVSFGSPCFLMDARKCSANAGDPCSIATFTSPSSRVRRCRSIAEGVAVKLSSSTS
jgi:hypothetical protein